MELEKACFSPGLKCGLSGGPGLTPMGTWSGRLLDFFRKTADLQLGSAKWSKASQSLTRTSHCTSIGPATKRPGKHPTPYGKNGTRINRLHPTGTNYATLSGSSAPTSRMTKKAGRI